MGSLLFVVVIFRFVGGRWSVGAAGGSAASAVGGLGARGGALQRELDAELVGAVLPLAGALHLVGADRGVELQGEPAAHAHRRGGGLRCDRGDQGALLRVAGRAQQQRVLMDLLGGLLTVDGDGRRRGVRAGLHHAGGLGLDGDLAAQSITSQAPPGSAQPVSAVQAVSASVVAWKETAASISCSASPPYSTGNGSTETGKVWCGSCTRSSR